MDRFRIFVDFAATPEVLELLQAGTQGHQLVFPRTPVPSVLAKAERDPQFATVDIAFGQPEPEAIAETGQLKWIHISTSGITRYDNPQLRELMAERKIPVTNSASVYARGGRTCRRNQNAGPPFSEKILSGSFTENPCWTASCKAQLPGCP